MIGELLLRADASTAVGAGHFMRVLTLGRAWQRRGGAVSIVSHRMPPGLAARAAAAGFSIYTATSAAGADRDCEDMCRHIATRSPAPWVALDGYGFSADYQSAIRAAGASLLIIDDDARHPFYTADILLNQNGGAEELSYSVDDGTRLLLGPTYALVRDEFRRSRETGRTQRPRAERLLVTFGGADISNHTARVLQVLRAAGLAHLETRTILGATNVSGPNIREEIARWNEEGDSADHEVLSDVKGMATHMVWADIAIAAAGTTTWELACCGTPAILVVTAANQRRSAAAAARAGAAIDFGEWVDGWTERALGAAVLRLVNDPVARARMAACGRALVDGLGAERVVDTMRSVGMRGVAS